MKNEWPKKRLGDIAEIIMGQSPAGETYNVKGEGIPLINGPVEFSAESFGKTIRSKFTTQPTKFCKENDLILCVRGSTTGRMNIAGFDACVGRGVAAIRATDYQPWINHFIASIRDKIHAKGTGATFPNVSGSILSDFELIFPPLVERQRIVATLDEAFQGIATAKANAEKNLQNARALFASYLESVFSQSGDGYAKYKLGEVCSITSKLIDPRKEEFIDLTHVGAGNIESQTGVFVDLRTAREEGLISGKFLFDESMTLYSKIRPYLMKVARPNFNGMCSADMYPLAPSPGYITRDYLFYLLLSKPFTDYAIQGSARAGMPKVNREHLFEFVFWLPTIEMQQKIAAKLDVLHEEAQRLEGIYLQKLTALDDLKRSLLHQAFSGQL